MESAISWIVTNQQIPKTLPGAALWCHLGSQKWCCTQVHEPYHVTQQAPWPAPWVIQTRSQLRKNQIPMEQFYMGSQLPSTIRSIRFCSFSFSLNGLWRSSWLCPIRCRPSMLLRSSILRLGLWFRDQMRPLLFRDWSVAIRWLGRFTKTVRARIPHIRSALIWTRKFTIYFMACWSINNHFTVHY